MPRKTSTQAVKKDTADEAKNETVAPRRSGRAVAKQETSGGKEATRSRRSSTAAQTAASVAESKSPKGRNSTRDSYSPSESRTRTGKEGGLESPATRVKSTRRSTSQVNYKESDGEEDVPSTKNDDAFDSNEEYDDSDSDEKSKSRGKAKVAKSPSKGRSSKGKAKSATRRGRGRPSKKKKSYDDEESDVEEVSEEEGSAADDQKEKPSAIKESPVKSGRGRKPKSVPATAATTGEEPAKPSRRSARTPAVKEVEKTAASRRPSRSVQAKRYTEDYDDDDIEEISDSKPEDEPERSSRKRKSSTASESNKRLKEDDAEDETKEAAQEEEMEEDVKSEGADKESTDAKELKDEEASGEPMDTESDKPTKTEQGSGDESMETEPTSKTEKSSAADEKGDSKSERKENVDAKAKEEVKVSPTKEKLLSSDKQDSMESSENFNESIHSSDSEQGGHSISSGMDDSQESKEIQKGENVKSSESNVRPSEDASQSSESFQQLDENSEESKEYQASKKGLEPTGNFVGNAESSTPKPSINEVANQDTKSKPLDSKAANVSPSKIVHSKELGSDNSVNGSERQTTANPAHPGHIISPASNVIYEHKENPISKANGAHEMLHTNSTPSIDEQHFPFPGRKYVSNTKLNESIRHSVKDKTFGFLSYSLGSTPDVHLQKEKLLHELNKLQAHVICLQQVARSFYNTVLEPSLDALGFKGTFSQPEEGTNGLATFYKTSCFRIVGKTEISLKKLIEKEIENTPVDPGDMAAIKSHLKQCGSVLFAQLMSVIGNKSLTVANVQIPRSDVCTQTMQVTCLAREVFSYTGGAIKPLLMGGDFSMVEGEPPYQLLRDGYLTEDVITELQRRRDLVLPGKEDTSLVAVLWKAFQHPSCKMCSCYFNVLDHELLIPGQKTSSADLIWFNPDRMYTVGVLDVISDKCGESHITLKADVAFSI